MTEEANYNMIDGLNNNAAPKKKKKRPKESVLAKLHQKRKKLQDAVERKPCRKLWGKIWREQRNSKEERLVTWLWLVFFIYKKTGQ